MHRASRVLVKVLVAKNEFDRDIADSDGTCALSTWYPPNQIGSRSVGKRGRTAKGAPSQDTVPAGLAVGVWFKLE